MKKHFSSDNIPLDFVKYYKHTYTPSVKPFYPTTCIVKNNNKIFVEATKIVDELINDILIRIENEIYRGIQSVVDEVKEVDKQYINLKQSILNATYIIEYSKHYIDIIYNILNIAWYDNKLIYPKITKAQPFIFSTYDNEIKKYIHPMMHKIRLYYCTGIHVAILSNLINNRKPNNNLNSCIENAKRVINDYYNKKPIEFNIFNKLLKYINNT